MAVLIKKPYAKHERQRFDTGSDSRAKQSFKDESDINNIMAKYLKTGVLDYVKENAGQYLDLPEGMDYQSAMNITIAAGEAFDNLPGSIRKRFDNNAVEFLDFMNDEDTLEEQVELGLREKMPEEVEPPLDPMDQPAEPAAPPPE